VKTGGRVGVLTSLTSSVPQLYLLFDRFRKSIDPAWKLFNHFRKDIGQTWKTFRRLRETFADGAFIVVPSTADEVAGYLAAGGLVPVDTWTETIRMWFESGEAAVAWARGSGYATHPALDHVGPEAQRFLARLFADGLETFREERGIPIDLVVAGVIAERR
jgi:hypothetical protein